MNALTLKSNMILVTWFWDLGALTEKINSLRAIIAFHAQITLLLGLQSDVKAQIICVN